jgi:hypothetical protein
MPGPPASGLVVPPDGWGRPRRWFGALVDGDIRTITFSLDGVPKDDRQALIESVLATVVWG